MYAAKADLSENTEHSTGNVDITLFSIFHGFPKDATNKFFCSLYFLPDILRQFVLHSRLVEQYLVFANGFFHLYKHLPDSQQNVYASCFCDFHVSRKTPDVLLRKVLQYHILY